MTQGSVEPLVSCVMPVFDGERFVAESVESVLAQTYPHVELIVADDGSNDGSANAVRSFSPQGVQLLQQDNGGSASARNLGIGIATGEFVALLDADDLWTKDKIARQLDAFANQPALGVCMTHMQNFWEPEFAHEAAENPRLAAPQPGAASCFMARRSVFDDIGLFDSTIAHRDIQDWILRAKRAGWRLDVLPDVLVRRRIHGHNVSRNRITGESELLDMASKLLARKKAK